MKRFLMLVGVAVVAAAMYVAASPASQRSSGPTEKQFLALQKKVTAQAKTLKAVKAEASQAYGFIATCFVTQAAGALPTSEFGDAQAGTFGYSYTPSQGAQPISTTALDIDGGATPQGYLQTVDPACVSGNGLRHGLTHSGSGFSAAHAERLSH
jgi:hypothetical protein